LWDSKLTKIDARDMGPHRDLIGELAAACRKKDLKFGLSNHGIENFTFINPSKAIIERLKAAKVDLFDPEWKDIYHYADRSEAALTEFLTDWVERNIELIDNYQPDMLWFDNGVNGAKDRELDPLKLRVAAHYYNRALQWKKEVSISTKGLAYAPSGDNFKQVGSIIDVEKIGQRSPPGIRPGPWQVDHPIGSTWGYTEGMKVSSANSIIPQLVDTISKGGNFLLNLSPMADGTIPQAQQDTLLGIGRWLEVNGEAIYGTRPWGPVREDKLRSTTRGSALYFFLLGKPGKQLEIKALGGVSGIGKVELLGRPGELKVVQTDTKFIIDLPADLPPSPVLTFKISAEAQ
jgi:alpha-L-fucosidase